MSDAKVRGENALRILNDPLFIEAFNILERDIIEQWDAVPVRDVEGRELLWRFYKTAKKFRGILQGVVENGKVTSFREMQDKTFLDKTRERFTNERR